MIVQNFYQKNWDRRIGFTKTTIFSLSAGGGESGEYAKQEKKILVTSEEGVLTLKFLKRHFNDASLKLTIEVTEVKEGLGTLTKRVEASSP
ncbi:hypothetical protein YC2023_009994 [Brassica napus]